MIKRIVILGLACLLFMTGCSGNNNFKTSDYISQNPDASSIGDISFPEIISEPLSLDDWVDILPDKQKNWSGMTSKEYIEDFDYLYAELQENYPFFGVAMRKDEIDFHGRYLTTRKILESCNNDVDYRNFLREHFFSYIGHLDLWGTRYLTTLPFLEEIAGQSEEMHMKFTPYLEALKNPVSEVFYKRMDETYNKLYADYDKYLIDAGNAPNEESQSGEVEQTQYNNVETKILEDGNVAYISIRSFDMSQYEADKETLFAFYKQVADYENIIFDISENGGGGMDYFTDLVVAPNIDYELSVPVYVFIKAGENNRRFLFIDDGIQSGEWQPVTELPVLPRMNVDDLKELDYFSHEPYTVEPLNNEKSCKGKIWLLVSERNYSSSEFAAMFSKGTGFATLVGKPTSGDGIGTDPVYIVLPNSGLIVQYSPIYGTTADGANSEEFGTQPDIEAKAGESAVDTCLRIIRER